MDNPERLSMPHQVIIQPFIPTIQPSVGEWAGNVVNSRAHAPQAEEHGEVRGVNVIVGVDVGDRGEGRAV